MKAKYIMTRDVVTARPNTPVRTAEKLLREHHISGMPVVDQEGHVLGVFSLSDVLKKGKRKTVGELMTSPAITADEDEAIEEVAALMATNNVNRIPIVREGRLVGIITRADIVRYVASQHAWIESEERA